MRKHEIRDYSSVEEYKEFSEIYRLFTGLLIFSMQRYDLTIKRRIIRNFMSKSVASLQGVFSLWEINNYQDCYVLMRVITDRLFHLYDLIENERFEEFDDWSFYQQYNSRNKIRSDKEFNKKIILKAFEASPEEKDRFSKLQKKEISYERPKPETVSKAMDIHFVYKFGYDDASKLVHPMANDGWEDLINLTGLYADTERPDHRGVLSNSLLSNHLLHQHGMQCEEFIWCKEVGEFMNSAMEFLKTGNCGYKQSFSAIADLGARAILCKEI